MGQVQNYSFFKYCVSLILVFPILTFIMNFFIDINNCDEMLNDPKQKVRQSLQIKEIIKFYDY